MEKLEERIWELENVNNSNCMGTALYLAGLRDKDVFMTGSEAYAFIKNLKTDPIPKKGRIFSWEIVLDGKVNIVYLGVIENEDPLVIISRRDGKLSRNSFEEMKKFYGHGNVYYKIYAPELI